MADDRLLVDQVVRFAFVIRLASLGLVALSPGESSGSVAWITAVLFVTVTSTAGLFRTARLSRLISSHPLLVVLDVVVALAIAVVLGSQSPILLYALSTAVLVGILMPTRPALATLGVLVIASTYLSVLEREEGAMLPALIVPVAYATVGGLGCLTRVLLESTVRQQRRARMLGIEAARERERARLAREMHDSVAKALHGIGIAAAALPLWAERSPDTLVDRARELQEAAEAAAADARAILVEMRADADDRTLVEQLRDLARGLEKGGINVVVTIGGIGDCDHAIKRELVAIAGEAVENITRHSQARHVALTCAATPSTITLTIRDDGVGFEPDDTPVDHFGVVGMYERAETIGAELDVRSEPGAGTTISVSSPRIAPVEQT